MATIAVKAAATPQGRRLVRIAILALLGLMVLPLLLVVLIIMPAAECNPEGAGEDPAIPGTWNGPGSLGGVAGTGVSATELASARQHGGPLKITAGPYRSTAYAPIAGGVNCGNGCAATASGIRVDSGRRRAYLIASNPRLLSYGALVYIWPNPYSWRGPFVVADTGGDFGGAGRLDFYTFEPRSLSTALTWGNTKMVRVSANPIVSGGPGGDASDGPELVPVANAIAPAAPEASTQKWPAPVPGPITSGFGPRSSPGGIGSTNHEGIDFGVPVGTPIKVPVAGRVNFAGTMSGYGNYICVLHQPQLESCYAHLSKISVSVGRAVAAGQVLGLSGNTGNSTGPHLHFEVRRSSTPAGDPAVDPRKFLSGQAPAASAVDVAENQCPGAAAPDVAGSVDPNPNAAVGYPTRGGQGQIIGRPGEGTHSYTAPPNNWQSDRAVDIGIPAGTPLYATEDGVICASCGFGTLDASASSRFGGMRFTLTTTSGRQWYYAHLSRLSVRRGQHVKRGELVGYSGVANGVAHLHLGVSAGDPLSLLGINKQV